MAGSTLDRRSLGFALGLIGFAWAALILLGPLALFLTWYGDCFSAACPSATRLDGAIYLFDIVALVAVAVIALIAAARPRRGWFAVVALIDLAVTIANGAGLAELLVIALAAGLVVVVASIRHRRGTRDNAP